MKHISKLVALIGATLVVIGVGMIAEALGLIVLGVMMITVAAIREGGI